MSKAIDLTGQRFGLLVVTSRAPNYERYSRTHGRTLKYARWNCLCDCGEVSLSVLATDLKSGSQVSCGCVRTSATRERSTTHGKSNTKEHLAWKSMKDRCFNKNTKKFHDYGGRGIGVQPDWVDSFETFLSYVGPAPSDNHTLDRIDSNGNYEEGNVRWTTRQVQAQNTRKPKYGKNKYKWVSYNSRDKYYETGFVVGGTKYSAGNFKCEEEAAREIYSLFRQMFGIWPKYCDEALVELGLLYD